MNQKLFSKNFTMVIMGQIISLFGNAMVRFVLPLYLINQTGSAALYGMVTACAFIPAVILAPMLLYGIAGAYQPTVRWQRADWQAVSAPVFFLTGLGYRKRATSL